MQGSLGQTGSRFSLAKLLIALALLGACAPTADEQQVITFAEGVNGAEAVIREYRTSIDQATADARILDLVRGPGVAYAPACQSIAGNAAVAYAGIDERRALLADYRRITAAMIERSPECTLLPNEAINPLQPAASCVFDLMPLLGAYAKGLIIIASSKSSDVIANGAAEVRQALTNLTQTALTDLPQANRALTLLTPISSLVEAGGTLYLDRRRYDALKHAITAAEVVMPDATSALSKGVIGLHIFLSNQLIANSSEKAALASRVEAPVRFAAARDSLEDFDAYRTLLKRDPSLAFTAMAEAHSALYEALNDITTQRAAVIDAVKRFVRVVKELQAAFNPIERSNHKPAVTGCEK